MALKDKVITDRDNIISMIACAGDYGHDNQITAHFFWGLLEKALTDEEITQYAASVAAQPGYCDKDREAITEDLTEWRARQAKWNARRGAIIDVRGGPARTPGRLTYQIPANALIYFGLVVSRAGFEPATH